MRKIIFILIFITALTLPGFISASGGNLSLEDILGEIMTSQNVNEAVSIDCQKVTDEQFDERGDAAMGLIHPNKQQHELMDQMMGGEGSESLKAMHISMGRNYLGCGSGVMGGGMMGGTDMMSMMRGVGGGGMMNGLTWSMGNMMGNFGVWGWFGWTFMLLLWILPIIAIVALIKWIFKK